MIHPRWTINDGAVFLDGDEVLAVPRQKERALIDLVLLLGTPVAQLSNMKF